MKLETNSYLEGYKLAVQNGKPWITLITESWCAPCQRLKAILQDLQDEGLKFNLTLLGTKDENALKIIRESNHPDRNKIPFCNVWQYNGQMFEIVYRKVGVPGESRDQETRILEARRTLTRFAI